MESPMEQSDSSSSSSSSDPDILHPELLSKDKLVKLLRERQIKVDNKDDPDKSFLVELFQRTVMPLPQRTPRNNRRGKRTRALIKKMDAKKPKREDKTIEYQNPKKTPQPKRGLLISSDINLTPGSRLKPPPVVINRKKTIKLNSSSSSSSKHLDKKVNEIRTGVTNIRLLSSSSKGANGDAKKSAKQRNTQESVQSVKPARTKITYSDSPSDGEKQKQPGPETNHGKLVTSLNNSTEVSPPAESVKYKTIKTNRSSFTNNDGSKLKGSPRLSVATSGKDAIRKALGAPSQEQDKGEKPTERSPVKRHLDTGSKENDVSDKKRRKITWP